jgi:hypothetical protein
MGCRFGYCRFSVVEVIVPVWLRGRGRGGLEGRGVGVIIQCIVCIGVQ